MENVNFSTHSSVMAAVFSVYKYSFLLKFVIENLKTTLQLVHGVF
jgi:hypothetical protein